MTSTTPVCPTNSLQPVSPVQTEAADSRRYVPSGYATSSYAAAPYGSYPGVPAYPATSSSQTSSSSSYSYPSSTYPAVASTVSTTDRYGSGSSRYGSDSRYSGSSSSYGSSSYGSSRSDRDSRGGSSYDRSGSSYGSSSRGYDRDSRGGSSHDRGGSDSRYSSSSYGRSDRYDRDDTDRYGSSAYRPDEPTDEYTQATFSVAEKVLNADSETDVFSEIHNTGINFSKYENIPVSVTGSDAPPCISTFAEAKFHHYLMDNVNRTKYTVPTPVQKYSFPIVATGRDLMACAQTGSGKTAAFLLPVINKLLHAGCYSRPSRMKQTPEALILAPTRELASQIHAEALKFCFKTGLRTVVCYGGAPIGGQLRELEGGCNILVGTPGRLIDMVDRGKVGFSAIQYLVLDEADRMLDMGFEKDIRQIVERRDMSSRRQTLMFSATFPKEIRQLATDFLQDYLFLKVGRVGSTTESITQHLKYLKSFDKQAEVVKELRETPGKTLIFAETKRDTDSLARYLFSQGFHATGIHGDRAQREREAALRGFKAGKIQILVATDVAARGLDIDDVAHVINYDIPANIDSYIHRIGRTGRAGNLGKATSYFTDDNKGLARAIVKVLREANQVVPDWLDRFALEGKKGTGGPMRRGGYGGRYNPYGGASAHRGPSTYGSYGAAASSAPASSFW